MPIILFKKTFVRDDKINRKSHSTNSNKMMVTNLNQFSTLQQNYNNLILKRRAISNETALLFQ